LTLVQEGLDKVLGVYQSRGYQPVVPVWRDGENGEWQRVDERTIQYTHEPHQFRFQIKPNASVCYVSFCYPYTQQDWQSFVQTLPADYIRQDTVGVTKQGRPYPRVLVQSPKANPKNMVLLTARQHAGEVSGSYVLEGFLKRLMDGSAEMEALLAQTAFCVFPLVDLDCVEEGRYGKGQAPCDFNRDWGWKPYHVEIRNIYGELGRLSQDYFISYSVDLHAPQPGGASYMPPSRAVMTGSPEWNRMWNLAIRYEDACKGKVSFALKDVDTQVLNWAGKHFPGMRSWYFANHWNCGAVSFEYAYHRDSEGRILTIKDWYVLGEKLVETLASSLFDPCLKKTPDMDRIPQWAVPQQLKHWSLAQKIEGVDVSEVCERTVITAKDLLNKCWIVSRYPQHDDIEPACWEFVADSEMKVELYASWFKEGLLLSHTDNESVWLHKDELFRWTMPDKPEKECKGTVGIVLQNIPGKLEIRRSV